jgi:hypothetical protein
VEKIAIAERKNKALSGRCASSLDARNGRANAEAIRPFTDFAGGNWFCSIEVVMVSLYV